MEERIIKVEIPEGFEIDKDKSTFENIVLKKKENKEKEMSDFLFSIMQETICKINEEGTKIDFYNKNNEWLIQQDYKNNNLYVSYYRIWSLFEKKFKLNYQEIKDFITSWMEIHYKCKGLTTKQRQYKRLPLMEIHYKCKGLTTCRVFITFTT